MILTMNGGIYLTCLGAKQTSLRRYSVKDKVSELDYSENYQHRPYDGIFSGFTKSHSSVLSRKCTKKVWKSILQSSAREKVSRHYILEQMVYQIFFFLRQVYQIVCQVIIVYGGPQII